MKKQFGRSMIEMLGVLAIVGVLSIVGITMYRRAVNNHHANTILDDVNRFAFVITEKGGYPLEQVIPKGDFKESGIYMLEGYQDVEANQFSITVENVPKGVCEALLPKAAVEYKVRVNPNANEKGKVYDTLNTELCQNDTNIMVFYFGDTADLCNPKEDGYTPCTVNSDCCGGEFCLYAHATDSNQVGEGNGQCQSLDNNSRFRPKYAVLSNGQRWAHSHYATMGWWSAQNWCAALGMKPASREDLNCSGSQGTTSCADSSPLFELVFIWGNTVYHWLNEQQNNCAVTILIADAYNISAGYIGTSRGAALCHE